MNWLRSLIFNVLFLAGTGLILIVVSPVLLMTTRHALKFVAWWSTIQAAMLRVVVGLDHEVRGLENIPEGGFIIASKHQSAWDTFFFFVMFRNPAYVLKKELLNIPVWGLYVRKCRAIVVDRDGGASAMKALIRDTRDRLAAGRPVVIFPEGTRTAPGTGLDYHPGIAAMYAQCDVPVVPVAVNSGVFWGRFIEEQPKDFQDHMRQLLAWCQEGKLRPHIETVYPIEKTVEALGIIADRQATGKILIQVKS